MGNPENNRESLREQVARAGRFDSPVASHQKRHKSYNQNAQQKHPADDKIGQLTRVRRGTHTRIQVPTPPCRPQELPFVGLTNRQYMEYIIPTPDRYSYSIDGGRRPA